MGRIRVFATGDGRLVVHEDGIEVPDAVVTPIGNRPVQSGTKGTPVVPGDCEVTVVLPDGREFRRVPVESGRGL